MMRRAALLVALVALTGCSQFRSRERMNLAPFAEYTVSLAADIEYGAGHINKAHLRQYRDDPSLVAHRAYWEKIRFVMRGVVAYSVEISTLGSSSLDEQARNERFAVFLDRLIRPTLELQLPQVRHTTADLDRMLAQIRQQERFLDALREAQPFIDELARVADELFDETLDDMSNVFATIDARIAADNAGPVMTWDEILEAQNRIFASMGELRLYQIDQDPAHIERVYANEPDYVGLAADPLHPTTGEIIEMRQGMVEKLRLGIDVKELLAPDLERYYEQQKELDELYNAARIQLKKARIAIIVWARAHRNLAEGVTDPARVDIFNITKKAVSTVL